MIMKAYNNPNFEFIADESVVDMQIDMNFSSRTQKTTVINSIKYNPDYQSQTSEMGHELAILHEFCHPVLTDLGIETSNYSQHNAMQTNTAFDAAIRTLYPGYTDLEYKYMKLSGCADATDYTSKTREEKNIMNDFLRDKKIILTKKATNNNP